MFRIFTIVFALASIFFSQQTSVLGQESLSNGEKIIRKSREATGLEKQKFESVQYKVKTSLLAKTPSGRTIPDFFSEVSLSLPDKIQTIFLMGPPIASTSTQTWNGEKYKSFLEIDMLGQRIVKDNTNADRDSSRNKDFGILEGKIDKDKLAAFKNTRRLDPKVILLEEMWTQLFPLILTHPFEKDVKFNYIGKAKANNITANVVDFKPKNGKSYRLLFDTETNYLLMMIVTYKRNDPFFVGDQEMKYYFSNRELTGDILIPKKIKVENKQTAPGKPPKITFSNIDILEFKLNPELKQSMFEIK